MTNGMFGIDVTRFQPKAMPWAIVFPPFRGYSTTTPKGSDILASGIARGG